jgi:DNA repair protein RAD50
VVAVHPSHWLICAQVGANGCGKTTVIECLKFGTTGQAPPGSASGKAFVHDPKVTGVSEVKAQLKLRFKNYGGQRMVVVRSMQLTQKKTTATFKQLDGVIRATKPDGSKTSYTHKCGELDKTVPIMIGAISASHVGAFASIRLVSRNDGSGWFIF